MITQKKLKQLFIYDADTGHLRWRNSLNRRVKAGERAGCLSKGYRLIGLGGKTYKAHQLVWLYVHGEWPKLGLDHINHDRDDNRIENLRDVGHAENQRNKGMPRNNTSGVVGVLWCKRDAVWSAQMTVNRRGITLRTTSDFFEACCARKSAENRYGFHPNHGKPRAL